MNQSDILSHKTTQNVLKCVFLAGILLFVIIFAWMSIKEYTLQKAYKEVYTEKGRGKVVDIYMTKKTRNNYLVCKVEFSNKNGQKYLIYTRGTIENPKVGDWLPVRYNPKNPKEECIVDMPSEMGNWKRVIFVFSIFLLLFTVFCYYFWLLFFTDKIKMGIRRYGG
jgi:hypothetical protein